MGLKISTCRPKINLDITKYRCRCFINRLYQFHHPFYRPFGKPAKEVGVRKVIGGTKKALVVQFLTESLLLAFFSTLIGLALVYLLLPYFNQLSGRELSFSFAQFPQLTGLIAGLVLIVGLLSGCYPALVLSGFNTVDVLKAKIRLGGANFFTKALVTFQFVLSATLIVSAIIIMQQLRYMESKNPGFDKENVLVCGNVWRSGCKTLIPGFQTGTFRAARHFGFGQRRQWPR
jgi:putative ABC transport system permease protein